MSGGPALAADPPDQQAVLAGADALAAAVLENNPDLRAIEARIDAVEASISRASVWADPMVAAEYSNMPFARPYPGGHSMSGIQLRLQQTFPFPGKIEARKDAARGRVSVATASLPERQNALVGAVRVGWVRLGLVRQLRSITRSHIELVGQLAEVVQVRTEVGRANQVDLQRLTLLRSRLEDDLEDFDRDEAKLLATLNAALHRAGDTPIETPRSFPLLSAPPHLSELIALSLSEDPGLARLEAEARAEELDSAAARVEGRPDLTGWLGYRLRAGVPGGDPGDDFFSIGVSLPLPWFWNDRRWGSVAAAHQARARGTREAIENRRDLLRGEVEAIYATLHRTRSKGATYRERLVPDAHSVLDATFAVYPTGKADFESVFQAELQLLDLERGLRMVEAEAWTTHYELQTLTGQNLGLLEQGKNR